MRKHHSVENLRFNNGLISLVIDGQQREFRLDAISRVLARATQVQLEACEVSPSGYGIHWPLLDEDLSIDGLLGIRHEPSEHHDRA